MHKNETEEWESPDSTPCEWELIRRRGRLRYVFVQGGLLALIVILWIYIWRFFSTGVPFIPELAALGFELTVALCISMPVYAFVMWPLNEYFHALRVVGNEEADAGL